MKKQTRLTLVLVLFVAVLLLSACGGENNTVVECPEPVPCPECEECPVVEEYTGPDVPFLDDWQSSGHADSTAEAFRHWDEEDVVAVPADCAKCHSTYGYQDFVGADGTAFGTVDAEDFPVDSTVECVACHNQATLALTSVVMPSGAELTGLGSEARCMQCHQGRASGLSVDEATVDMDPDTVNEELGFINIHYFAAAATKYGTLAHGGYQYEGKTYDGNFGHVEEFDSCTECHNPHTLEVRVESCAHCHEGVETIEDLHDVRMLSSAVDYDGDGDLEEGIAYEIEGLQEQLYAAMQVYAADTIGTAIVYDSQSYPYFFVDLDANGEGSEDEINYGNRFLSWTPRLLKAAYNFQVSMKDPGGFAHGGKYIIQLLVDSIEDLGADVGTLQRIDHGHFAGSEEAFRHWDADGEVSASCARCHSAEGLPYYLETGKSVAAEISNGFQCSTCHGGGDFPARYDVSSATFPSGAVVSADEPSDQFLCMQCHQGRASGLSVDEEIADAEASLAAQLAAIAAGEVVLGEDEAEPTLQDFLGFVNVHYFAAGATRYGSEVTGMYEFTNRTYAGYFEHVEGFTSCTACHDAHELEVKVEACATCHTTENLDEIRIQTDDFDGDGDVEEGLRGEIEGLNELLYATIQAYAAENAVAIVYDSHSYPYFFVDTNGDGEGTADEINYGNQYRGWTPELLRAAYNYQYAQKDPGAFAHNGTYVIQVLYDSIQSLGGDLTGLTRP